MESLAGALEQTPSREKWWAALVQELSPLDLVAVRWTSPAATYERRKSDSATAWTFRVPLTATDVLELEGGLNTAVASFDFAAFAQTVSRTFPPADVSEPSRATQKPAPVLP